MPDDKPAIPPAAAPPAAAPPAAAPPAAAPPAAAPTAGPLPPEVGGAPGPEPTRYGDWQHKGRVTDF